ncbi:beta-amylase 2, chloroplastic isoform X2 [Physcomitrium patens]|uniref:Beta-amylase n=1 Tax=Physcomitrium patens TaxID=3218 RepID=A0A7I4FGR7_PHYPA|nr:beta-amylase 2, chloroplastic-like isoform X2 [Physcomitrium patens]XP_024364732.1 beta-amylase 2, chloroplastic-like isoform X2 [Physcomitrium patens]XP_024364734.1 beta-amylase 2, chloroplastic-like isoform X2 [Physcomitrium patens]XP_024364735.1 beta-amylase 2, chloroplastic-like isoform X2 [Physcomitrium patens]|eukprot:XP_024364731.1 beta-amylase 2, chloroplastic-like isoform X2 [Physcomitrella patens]
MCLPKCLSTRPCVKHRMSEEQDVIELERDYTGTKHIPIFVMLPLDAINSRNEIDDLKSLRNDLNMLKKTSVDGVMVDCWWGLVEAKGPKVYDWSGYKNLFEIVRELQLKLQVVMSFHQCGGNVGDDTFIPLPQWVREVGKENPDIFFTNRKNKRNPECLTWGVDEEPVLRGRTGLEVYRDFMENFRQEMTEFFHDGTIVEIEVGLGPCGELRYPSYPETQGWVYPGIGEFQCYDKYLLKGLKEVAEAQGHKGWGKPPSNTGSYNSKPQYTEFFRDGGDYDSYYGRFFLGWYSKTLIEHGDRVLSIAITVFSGTKIAAKISGIHWWYQTASHAAELTCGYYNTSFRDGYSSIAQMFAKHKATFNFTCVELLTSEQNKYHPEAMADPEGLVQQVFKSVWGAGVSVASENALACYDRRGYNKILENAKPRIDSERNVVSFTYLRLNPELMEHDNYLEFTRFVRRLHGKSISDLPVVMPKPKTVPKMAKKHEKVLNPLISASKM